MTSTSGSGVATSVEQLLEAMDRLPSQGNVALRVLWMADDPNTGLADLARVVEADPVLVARLLHLANSAYYSPRNPIGTVERAITLLGFATVRTVATIVACGLGAAAALPQGFWHHAAAVANACQLVAWRFGVPTGDAFTVGLLHDLGRGLLHVAAPGLAADIELRLAATSTSAGGAERCDRVELELDAFGITHAEAAGRVLGSWRFPALMVEAISHHHDHTQADTAPSEMIQLLVAAEAIAAAAFGPWGEPVQSGLGVELLSIEPERLETIVHRVRTESGTLASVLGR